MFKTISLGLCEMFDNLDRAFLGSAVETEASSSVAKRLPRGAFERLVDQFKDLYSGEVSWPANNNGGEFNFDSVDGEQVRDAIDALEEFQAVHCAGGNSGGDLGRLANTVFMGMKDMSGENCNMEEMRRFGLFVEQCRVRYGRGKRFKPDGASLG